MKIVRPPIRMFAFAGKFALFIAVMALLTGVSLFVGGAYLASWPIMRVSPRNRRVQALMGLAIAVMATARAFDLDKLVQAPEEDPESATDDTEAADRKADDESPDDDPRYPDPYPYEEGDVIVLGPGCFVATDGSVLNLDGRNYIPQDEGR